MKYLKLFEEKEEFKMLEELKDILYILKDEGVLEIELEGESRTDGWYNNNMWKSIDDPSVIDAYGLNYRIYISPPKKKRNVPRGRLVSVSLIHTPERIFTHTEHYLEFLDRCQDICYKYLYKLEVFDGDNEIGHEPDVIFEMTPIVGMPTKNSKSPR